MSVRPVAAAFAFAAAMFVLVPASNAASPACPDAYAEPSEISVTELREAIICTLNVERVQRGKLPLRKSRLLRRAASGHSRSMVRNRFFGHQRPGGLGFGDRIQRSGYPLGANSWEAGENLAWGAGIQGTPTAIVGSWMASAQHRLNLLDDKFEQIGVGVTRGTPNGSPPNTMVVTADFGVRG